MKKTDLLAIILLLFIQTASAQSPANRSAKTIVADVLSQIPIDKQDEYNKIFEDLSLTGEEGVLSLVKMMKAPGKGSNANIEYALSGLSHFVTTPGKEHERINVTQAYVKALNLTDEREIKAFLLRQLQIVGQDECIETIAEYINDDELCEPATAALSAIGSPNAGKALISALKMRRGTEATQQNIIFAIGKMQAEGAEPVLLPFLNTPNEKTKKVTLYALSRVGTEKTLNDLEKASAASEYTMDKSDATDAYIFLLKRLSRDANTTSVVKKASKQLMQKAEKAKQTHTRAAALQILLSVSDEKERIKLLGKAIKSPDPIYRNAALTFASEYANTTLYAEIIKSIEKASAETKTDILTWIGNEANTQNKEIISKLMRDPDVMLGLLLTQELQEGSPSVQQAAAWTMVKIGDQAFIPTLTHLLTSTDNQLVTLGKETLLAFPGNISDSLNEAIKAAPEEGKIAGVEILAMRKDSSKIQTVLELTNNTSDKVKNAAYTALKDLATEQYYPILYTLLTEQTDEKYVKPLQEAVTAALNDMEKGSTQWEEAINKIKNEKNKKYLFYPVLASTGEQEALDILIEGYNKEIGNAKNIATEALLNWPDLRISNFLYNLSKTENSVSAQALHRYVELVSTSNMTAENKLLRLRKAMDIARHPDLRNLILQKVQDTGTFFALLYAGEFLDEKAVQQSAANAVMNIALNHKDYTGENIRTLLARVSEILNNPDAEYQRESIRKHLAEMPEETGFVSIFNGKDLTGWKGLVENPIAREKMSHATLAQKQKQADEQMRKDWKVENGLLVFDGTGFDNLCTEKKYGDFEMYIDWMLDPRGPEADAGIYLRGTPQVQIWDTARINVGAQVGSGGLYNNQINPSKPLKVADNPLGEWNTFYIKMVGDRVTVLLNGEKVVDDVILENYWDRKLPIPSIEQLELQAHGSKVYYRNIYVKELTRKEPFKLSAEEKKEGFQVLFDGTNMHEWTGNTIDYTIEDGCISMNPSKHFGGNLYTKKEFANFIFRFEFQLTPGANNGVGLRAPLEGDAAYVGMESQILDCEHEIYKDITKYQHHGSIYGIIPAKPEHSKAIKPVGEWNEEEIICDGDNIRVTVNGIVIVEGNIREATKNGTPDGQEHPGLFNKKGHIGFLGHGSPIKFRNIRIKELK